MIITYKIENLKCGGCANSIKKGLIHLENAKSINVDVENSTVVLEATSDISETVKTELSKLGYPVVGDKNTFGHKAKSFVSCAVGKMSKNED